MAATLKRPVAYPRPLASFIASNDGSDLHLSHSLAQDLEVQAGL
jgi:hypothetical protein